MPDPAFGFDRNDAARVRDSVLFTEGLSADAAPGEHRPLDGPPLVQGFLDGDLAAASDSATGETTATLSVWGGATLADTGRNVTVTNRRTDLVGEAGCYCVAYRINGIWLVLHVDCEETLTSGECPAGWVAVTFLTGYQCVSGVAVPCVRTVCLPPGTLVSSVDCSSGDAGSSEGVVEVGACEYSENLLATLTLSGCACGASVEVPVTWDGTRWTGSATLGSCSGETVTVTMEEALGVLNITVDFSCAAAFNCSSAIVCGAFGPGCTGVSHSVAGCCGGGTLTDVVFEDA